jgi:DNA polymerase-3 subunit delta'
MTALRTRGQPAASIVRSFAASGPPHAIVLSGPASVGKTTLATDLAATMLCTADDRSDRPCGSCRACRMVASGNHPDLHRVVPDGPSGQVGIAAVRALASDLALLPVEGGARLAIIESAHRLTEDAQHAMLKTLEEPPAGVTIVLCADEEERLLPTVRSRCARVRLGPVGPGEIEALLGELGLADAPTAARLARLAAGRPGLAIAYARAPDSVEARGEVARSLLDLTVAGRAERLRVVRDLVVVADRSVSGLAKAAATGSVGSTTTSRAARGRSRPAREPADDGTPVDPDGATRASASDRRRAAAWLIETWRDVARDLAVVQLGDVRAVRDAGLIDDLERVAGRLPAGAATAFLERLSRASDALEVNASPELLLDVLVLAWPRATAAAA